MGVTDRIRIRRSYFGVPDLRSGSESDHLRIASNFGLAFVSTTRRK
jgi:hypothetical protein